jgi:L-alanine-DL-glutamate epimerase-like enolase superfamily enzyme
VTSLIIKHGYKVADGMCRVPDNPGLGVELNLKEFEKAELVAVAEA